MKLADVIETFIPGDWGSEMQSDENPNAVSCIRGADIVPISHNEYGNIPLRYISNKALNTKTLKSRDIVIEKSGGSPIQSTGRVTLITDELLKEKGRVVCSNFCVAIRPKSSWNPLYVYYYWQYVYNAGVFFNYEGKTSGIKNLQLESALDAINLDEISIEKQNKIVAILSSIEKKMAINRRMNGTLERMAKELYDYWFVQFDYPGVDGKPYKSSGGKMVWNKELKREIPEGWTCASIFDELSVQYGFPFSTDLFVEEETPIPIVRIRDILENTVSAYSTENTDEKYRLNKGDLLIGMDGNFHMNYWNDNKAYLNQRSVRLRAKNESTVSIMQAKYEITPFIKAKEQRAKGSTVGHLSDKDLKELYVLVPAKREIRDRLDILLAQIISNRNESASLTKLRDELLPLLMNGQAKV